MAIFTLRNIDKSYQGRPILTGVDLSIVRGDKIGLVGRNGCGKTTLLEIIAGIVEPDHGERRASRQASVGIIAQEEDFGGCSTVIEAASQGQQRLRALESALARLDERIETTPSETPELDRLVQRQADLQEQYHLLGGYMSHSQVEAVLAGLGFPPEQFSAHPATLSGGEAKRLQMAQILLGGHDLLLLDEPGNHLDINGCEWLTRYLQEYPGTFMVISHDRFLLNAISDRIVELDQGHLFSFKGNYDAYVMSREERRAAGARTQERQQKQIEKEEDLIRRIHYGQKARQAKSRRKLLDRLTDLPPQDLLSLQSSSSFRFTTSRASGEIVLQLEEIAAHAGGRVLFEKIDLQVERGQVLGIIGPNGSGKSTLLEIILGRRSSAAGRVRLAQTVRPLYFDQSLAELSGAGTVLDELRPFRPQATEKDLRSHLARFQLRWDDTEPEVCNLSGGEKSRLLLARIACQEANLLVLDEPTNHLDIFSREALENALLAFGGTVVMVTHDRRLLDRTATHVMILDGVRSRLVHGNYSTLMDEIAATNARRPARSKEKERSVASRPAPSPRRVKRRHTFDELEELIMNKESRRAEIQKAFYTEEVYSNKKRYRELEEELERTEVELEELNAEWETWT